MRIPVCQIGFGQPALSMPMNASTDSIALNRPHNRQKLSSPLHPLLPPSLRLRFPGTPRVAVQTIYASKGQTQPAPCYRARSARTTCPSAAQLARGDVGVFWAGEGRGCTHFMRNRSRSRTAIKRHIPTMPGWARSDFNLISSRANTSAPVFYARTLACCGILGF